MKMYRSKTVTPSWIIIVIWIAGSATKLIPTETDQGPSAWNYLGWIVFVAWIRLTILWWQTLYNAVKYAHPDSRMTWVVGLILFGPFVSIPYYYKNRMPLQLDTNLENSANPSPWIKPPGKPCVINVQSKQVDFANKSNETIHQGTEPS